MTTLSWILVSGLAMSAIALVGGVALFLREATLQKLLLPLVALAAGSLIGGALFHMVPASLGTMPALSSFGWVALGFAAFFALEELLHWHHCHRAAASCRQPMGYLVLLGDALHNFIGGLAVGGIFVLDVRLGVLAWMAAAAHEVPQELGDFGVLVRSGWTRTTALLLNFLSGLTFMLGGVVAYAVSRRLHIPWLLPFAAGNFLYIGASDLVPEVNKPHDVGTSLWHFGLFALGLLVLFALALVGAG